MKSAAAAVQVVGSGALSGFVFRCVLSATGLWAISNTKAVAQVNQCDFRTGVPPTLAAPQQKPRPSAEKGVLDEFGRRYAAAKRPRTVLFWSREVGDDVGVEFQTLQHTREGGRRTQQSSTENTSGLAGSAQIKDDEIVDTREKETVGGTHRIDSGAHKDGLGERNDWVLESSFTSTLQNAGVRLVDRNVAMRLMQAKGNVSSVSEQQLVEARTLANAADWVIEVTLTPDAKAALGWAFRVNISDTHSGEILARTFSQGHSPEPNPDEYHPFVAGPHGFERAQPRRPPVTMETVGRQVAIEALVALTRRLP